MPKLPVAPASANDPPAIIGKQLENVSHFHLLFSFSNGRAGYPAPPCGQGRTRTPDQCGQMMRWAPCFPLEHGNGLRRLIATLSGTCLCAPSGMCGPVRGQECPLSVRAALERGHSCPWRRMSRGCEVRGQDGCEAEMAEGNVLSPFCRTRWRKDADDSRTCALPARERLFNASPQDEPKANKRATDDFQTNTVQWSFTAIEAPSLNSDA